MSGTYSGLGYIFFFSPVFDSGCTRALLGSLSFDQNMVLSSLQYSLVPYPEAQVGRLGLRSVVANSTFNEAESARALGPAQDLGTVSQLEHLKIPY